MFINRRAKLKRNEQITKTPSRIMWVLLSDLETIHHLIRNNFLSNSKRVLIFVSKNLSNGKDTREATSRILFL